LYLLYFGNQQLQVRVDTEFGPVLLNFETRNIFSLPVTYAKLFTYVIPADIEPHRQVQARSGQHFAPHRSEHVSATTWWLSGRRSEELLSVSPADSCAWQSWSQVSDVGPTLKASDRRDPWRRP